MPESDEILAGEHVLGLLEGAERTDVERLMSEDSAFRRAVETWSVRLATLLDDIQPVSPPPEVWEAIQARLPAAPVARRRQDGVWLEIAPGARMKLLSVTPATNERTALLRMDPGCVFPMHPHEQMEECLVLEGSVEIDGQTYSAGDYIVAPADSHHANIPSPNGALVLLHWNALSVRETVRKVGVPGAPG